MKGAFYMKREKAVRYAINSTEMEGIKYTSQEKEMWEKIAKGELPLEAALEDAQKFDRQMRESNPELYGKGDE